MQVSQTISEWWNRHLKFKEFDRAPRAFCAQLRRAATPAEVLADARVVALAQDLKLVHDLPRLISLVRVLAAVKDHSAHPLARKLGVKPREARVMSELRFQRILQTEQGPELETALIRALRMVEGRCHPGRLGADMICWHDETRSRWCFEYYGASVPEPLVAMDNDFEEITP